MQIQLPTLQREWCPGLVPIGTAVSYQTICAGFRYRWINLTEERWQKLRSRARPLDLACQQWYCWNCSDNDSSCAGAGQLSICWNVLLVQLPPNGVEGTRSWRLDGSTLAFQVISGRIAIQLVTKLRLLLEIHWYQSWVRWMSLHFLTLLHCCPLVWLSPHR